MRRVGKLASLGLALVFIVGSANCALAQWDDLEFSEPFSETADPCNGAEITIARMQWPSAAILAYIHAQLLSEKMGCDARVVTGDLAATTSSMVNAGEPLVAPELWLGRVADVWNAGISSGSVRVASPSFSGGALEGWFVPKKIAEQIPDLISISDLSQHWSSVAAEGIDKLRLISCPPDWACSIINRNLVKAFGLEDEIEIVEPSNRLDMDRLIGEAVSRNQPFLFYYWQPNAVLAQFDFEPVDLGGFNADAMQCLATRDCASPEPSSYPKEQVVIALSDALFTRAPRVAGYFQRASMPFAEMNALLAWQNESGVDFEKTAAHFVLDREEIWKNWLSH